MPRRKTAGGTFKRSGNGSKLEPICHGCHDLIDQKLAWRSRLWAYGTPGVHFLYCTKKCRTDHEGKIEVEVEELPVLAQDGANVDEGG